jgi:acyl-CoA thioesterase FadM
MNLLVRFLFVLLRAALGRRIAPGADSVLRLRVLPNDLDANGHMNNGRYATIMDLGRIDFGIRVGLLGPTLRRRWMPVIGGLMVRFRRSLGPFASYELRTRLLGWDDKWFVFEQRFERGGQLYAIGHVRALFRGPGRNVPTAEILEHVAAAAAATGAAGEALVAPPLPPFVARWMAAEEEAWAAARAPLPDDPGGRP